MMVSSLIRGVATGAAIMLLATSPARAQPDDDASPTRGDFAAPSEIPAAAPDADTVAPAAEFVEPQPMSAEPVPAPPPMIAPQPAFAVAPQPVAVAALVLPAPSCQPSPNPCVRILGLPGQQFYVVNKERFRHWATDARGRFNATRGIDRMLQVQPDIKTVTRDGRLVTQLPRRNQDYWIIGWCARDEGAREVYKASWQTRTDIRMLDGQVQQNEVVCQ